MQTDPASAPPSAPPGPVPSPRRRGRPLPPAFNVVLFAATVGTTLFAGTLLTLDDFSMGTMRDVLLRPSLWPLGVPYAACLILILGTHEMGHYLACRHYGVDASLPFFIPGPPIIGTFGALIRIRGPIGDRRALFDIGIAGPIAGFVVAIPVVLFGLSRSTVTLEPPQPGDFGLPSCLLLEVLSGLYFGEIPEGGAIRLHPTFMAGWVGLLATGLNLLPIGQLDGGHMLYALSARAHRAVSRLGVVALIALGLAFGGWHLVVFGIVFGFIGPHHPPPLDERVDPGGARVALGILGAIMLVLCLVVHGVVVI